MTVTASVPAGHPAPRGPLPLLGQVLGSSRPLSWVNTAYPFAAAYLLAGGGVDTVLVLGTFCSSSPTTC